MEVPHHDTLPASACRRGRPKLVPDEQLRVRVVEEAFRLFVAHGYGRTTMDDVAATCRMSKRTLYRLFPGKLDLFAAVVDAHRRNMLALPGAYDTLPLDTALEQIFRIDISPSEEQARIALFRLVVGEVQQFPELGEVLRRHGGDRSRAELAAWLAARHEAGQMVIDDAPAMARMLMDMIFGSVLSKATGDLEWPGGDARRAHVRRCIRVFLHGAVPVQAGPVGQVQG